MCVYARACSLVGAGAACAGGPEGCVLSHGDLHPGSVMVDNAMGKVKVDKVA